MNISDHMTPMYELGLHEHHVVNNKVSVLRVPGGWIYDIYDKIMDIKTTTFVPLNIEFKYTPEIGHPYGHVDEVDCEVTKK